MLLQKANNISKSLASAFKSYQLQEQGEGANLHPYLAGFKEKLHGTTEGIKNLLNWTYEGGKGAASKLQEVVTVENLSSAYQTSSHKIYETLELTKNTVASALNKENKEEATEEKGDVNPEENKTEERISGEKERGEEEKKEGSSVVGGLRERLNNMKDSLSMEKVKEYASEAKDTTIKYLSETKEVINTKGREAGDVFGKTLQHWGEALQTPEHKEAENENENEKELESVVVPQEEKKEVQNRIEPEQHV